VHNDTIQSVPGRIIKAAAFWYGDVNEVRMRSGQDKMSNSLLKSGWLDQYDKFNNK